MVSAAVHCGRHLGHLEGADQRLGLAEGHLHVVTCKVRVVREGLRVLSVLRLSKRWRSGGRIGSRPSAAHARLRDCRASGRRFADGR